VLVSLNPVAEVAGLFWIHWSTLTLYRMVMPIGTPFLKEKLIINQ